MQRFKNILLVCDHENDHAQASARALQLAQANGAKVTSIDVLDAAPGELNRLFAGLPVLRSAQIADQVRDFHLNRLEELAVPFRAAGIPTETSLLEGTAFLEIIRHVLREGNDLLVKGVKPEGVIGGLFTRGYDLHLLRKCPCPVWMIKDTDQPEPGGILAAVDPDPQDQTRDALNTMVMEMATSLAEADNVPLHIVNVWRLQEEQALRSARFSIDESEIANILAHEQAQSKARLDQMMTRLPSGNTPRFIRHIKGMADEVIVDYVADNAIETIVMGTVGRTGISGLFIGNTAEAILNTVNCSVIAVKPPGFISPVASTA